MLDVWITDPEIPWLKHSPASYQDKIINCERCGESQVPGRLWPEFLRKHRECQPRDGMVAYVEDMKGSQ